MNVAVEVGIDAVTVTLRVTSVRSRGRSGGAIFAGKTEGGSAYVVVASHLLIPDSSLVDRGQVWSVEGSARERELEVNGYRLREQQIEAAHVHLDRPAGRNVINWMAECPDCVGIGRVKASRLYERFGPTLVQHIDDRNVALLAEVVGAEAAEVLCVAFEKHGVAETLLWLDQMGIPRKIGASVADFYRDEAKAKVEANPYVLISFEAQWLVVDELARNRFGVAVDDPRRLEAAIEESLYRGLNSGHTCLPTEKVRDGLWALLGSTELVDKALCAVGSSFQFRRTNDGFQTTGAFLIERYLAERLMAMCEGRDTQGQGELFTVCHVGAQAVEAALNRYERFNGIPVTSELRRAVAVSSSSNVSLILGGAGTGKTTVLKALYQTLESAQPGLVIYQLALAGRAAQRMTEATGHESKTIAAFLRDEEVVSGSVVVVDEMSMVDAILMYRLLRRLPQGVRLVLVGDPSQLPPIGPGLVLHALAGHAAITQVELTAVQRQTSASGIPQVAASIREHQEPSWARYKGTGSGVSFIDCDEKNLDAEVERLYLELGGGGTNFDVQILSTTKHRQGGVKGLNEVLHTRFYGSADPVQSFNTEFGLVNEVTADGTRLTVGDLVLYTENDYQLGLRNGSLGRVTRALQPTDADGVCCAAEFDGKEYTFTAKNIRALSHAYAITVHKSQGSQFKRVIVPMRPNRLLDQSLIYTAVTRSVEQVVFVGDRTAAVKAIKAPAAATRRHTGLAAALEAAAAKPEPLR